MNPFVPGAQLFAVTFYPGFIEFMICSSQKIKNKPSNKVHAFIRPTALK